MSTSSKGGSGSDTNISENFSSSSSSGDHFKGHTTHAWTNRRRPHYSNAAYSSGDGGNEGDDERSKDDKERSAEDLLGSYVEEMARLIGEEFSICVTNDGNLQAPRNLPTYCSAIPATPLPVDFIEFSVPWFRTATGIICGVLATEIVAKGFLRCSDASQLATVSAKAVDTVFIRELQRQTANAVTPKGYGRTHRFLYAAEVKEASDRAMEQRIAALPDTFPVASSASSLLQNIDMALCGDALEWCVSFFPFYQFLRRNPGKDVNLLWKQEVASLLTVEYFSYQIYVLCTSINLLTNDEGFPKGVVVPKSWLRALLQWIAEMSKLSENERETCALPQAPGPIDTFSCVSISPCDPNKHWMKVEKDELARSYDVVPDRLFDFLYPMFGGGPRYMMYGNFDLREDFLQATEPREIGIDVHFITQSVDDDGTTVTEECNVTEKEAILMSDVNEVLRVALNNAEEAEALASEECAKWKAAINGTNTLHIAAKAILNDRYLPPVVVTGDLLNLSLHMLIKEFETKVIASHADKIDSWKTMMKEEPYLRLDVRLATATETDADSFVTAETVARCGVCGLTNVGNTCYMNSALQCLSNLTSFRRLLLALPTSRFPDCFITRNFIKVMMDLWSGQNYYAETRDLKDAIGRKVVRFDGSQQQDANEFIEVLLDRVHEEVNPVTGKKYRERLESDKQIPLVQLSTLFWENFLINNCSFVPELFFHQSKTVFTCLTCSEHSIVFDNNLTLSLNIKEPPAKRMVSFTVLVNIRVFDQDSKEAKFVPMSERLCYTVALGKQVEEESDGTLSVERLCSAVRKAIEADVGISSVVCKAAAGAVPCATSTRGVPGSEQRGGNVEAEEEAAGQDLVPRTTSGGGGSFDWRVEILEVPTSSCGPVYAWAVCTYTLRELVSDAPEKLAHAEVSIASSSTAETTGATPRYRFWYYLKSDADYDQFLCSTPAVFVEEILDIASCAADANGKEEEEVLAAAEEAPALAPLRTRLIHRGRELSSLWLKPIALDHAVPLTYEDDVYTSNDGQYSNAASGVAPVTSPPRQPNVRAKVRFSTVDVPKDLEEAGWAAALATAVGSSCASAGGNEMEKGDQGAVAASATASSTTTTNVCVFLQYDCSTAIPQHPKPLQVTEVSPYSSSNWRNGGRGDASDSDASCTLNECLVRSTMPDTLSGEDAWYCPKCKEFRETRVLRAMFRTPPCLIISFKRFKMRNAYWTDKNNTNVTFPQELDLAPYLDPEAAMLKQQTNYRLKGIVYHSGSLNYGHYTSSAFNDSVEQWVHYNDSNATLEKSECPLSQGAYILCYERIEK